MTTVASTGAKTPTCVTRAGHEWVGFDSAWSFSVRVCRRCGMMLFEQFELEETTLGDGKPGSPIHGKCLFRAFYVAETIHIPPAEFSALAGQGPSPPKGSK